MNKSTFTINTKFARNKRKQRGKDGAESRYNFYASNSHANALHSTLIITSVLLLFRTFDVIPPNFYCVVSKGNGSG